MLSGVLLCTTVVFSFLLCPTRGAGSVDYARLQNNLFRHTSKVIPIPENSDPVKVSLSMTLLSIDEVKYKYTTTNEVAMSAWIEMGWNDDALRWDPSMFGNITSISVPSRALWVPDVTVYNQIGRLENETPDLAAISNEGHVMFVQKWSLRSHCSKGSNDVYTCMFKLGSWTHSGFLVALESPREYVDLSNFEDNSSYDVINATALAHVTRYACCPEPYPDVRFNLEFKKLP